MRVVPVPDVAKALHPNAVSRVFNAPDGVSDDEVRPAEVLIDSDEVGTILRAYAVAEPGDVERLERGGVVELSMWATHLHPFGVAVYGPPVTTVEEHALRERLAFVVGRTIADVRDGVDHVDGDELARLIAVEIGDLVEAEYLPPRLEAADPTIVKSPPNVGIFGEDLQYAVCRGHVDRVIFLGWAVGALIRECGYPPEEAHDFVFGGDATVVDVADQVVHVWAVERTAPATSPHDEDGETNPGWERVPVGVEPGGRYVWWGNDGDVTESTEGAFPMTMLNFDT